ncbi:hypothetical protein N9D59_07720 [Burkholderiaceae bacterium]|nr:hypothetical protein [Burkholderiaceae bacterium]
MPKLNCFDSFKDGQDARVLYPLKSGRYKLRERYNDFVLCLDALSRIRRFVQGKGPASQLRRCTAGDKHIWLRGMPVYIADRLAYDLLPALLASDKDGVEQQLIGTLYPYLERRCLDLVAESERVRKAIYRSIENEYREMKLGGSLIEPLFDEAIYLFERALALHQEVGSWGPARNTAASRRTSS